jgi:hypothetical protein
MRYPDRRAAQVGAVTNIARLLVDYAPLLWRHFPPARLWPAVDDLLAAGTTRQRLAGLVRLVLMYEDLHSLFRTKHMEQQAGQK